MNGLRLHHEYLLNAVPYLLALYLVLKFF